MATDNESLIAQLWLDPLRHITPLKMVALYGAAMRVLPIGPAQGTANAGGLLLVSPRAISQYDQMNYGDVDWVVIPALPAIAGDETIEACVTTILDATGGKPFVLKTIDTSVVSALERRLQQPLSYRRALCTFGLPDARFEAGVLSDQSLLTTAHVPDAALPLLRAHGIYSDTELSALFADGSARCHIRFDAGHLASANAVAVLLTFANTPGIHEIGSLHVRADARRAGHARALLHWALADLQARRLAVRYVVDAANAPSIALAKAVGLKEQLRLEHWVSA